MNNKICSVCGTSLKEIIDSQKIGCPECYFTFEKEFKETLKSRGGDGVYKGSLPKFLKGYKSTLVSRLQLELKLEEAISNEEYEKAALYRDYLKVLNHDKPSAEDFSAGENDESK